MNRQTVNDTFSLQIPDSFEPVSAEELHSLSRGSDSFAVGGRKTRTRTRRRSARSWAACSIINDKEDYP